MDDRRSERLTIQNIKTNIVLARLTRNKYLLMNNAKQITTIAILIAVTSSIATYAFTAQNDPLVLIEAENKKAIRECLSSIDYESTSNQILRATETCSQLEIKKITGGNKLIETEVSSASGVIEVSPSNKTVSLECEWGERT